jgi:cytochrome P450 family 628
MSALRSYEPVIKRRIDQLIQQLDTAASEGSPIEVQKWIHYYVFDVMTDLAWGGGGKAVLTKQDPDGAIASLRYSLHLAGMTKALPWFAPILTKLPWISRKTKSFHHFSRTMFLQRRQASGKTGDVFHHLLGEADPSGPHISEGALQADSRQVVTGGADTTVSAITYLLFHLLASPSHFADLRAALDELANEHSESITHATLAKCSLLDAYINESLRLQPPIPYQNQRVVPPDGVIIPSTSGIGLFIPGGTNTRTALYAIARSPDNFARPDIFDPTRWLRKEDNLKASMPFIAGPYHCVGRNFAMMEMRMVIAEIVRRYDMQLIKDKGDARGKVDVSFGTYMERFEEQIEDRSVLEIEGELWALLSRRDGPVRK